MKLYTVIVMCMMEDNPGQKNIKGDNSREINMFADRVYPLCFD